MFRLNDAVRRYQAQRQVREVTPQALEESAHRGAQGRMKCNGYSMDSVVGAGVPPG